MGFAAVQETATPKGAPHPATNGQPRGSLCGFCLVEPALLNSDHKRDGGHGERERHDPEPSERTEADHRGDVDPKRTEPEGDRDLGGPPSILPSSSSDQTVDEGFQAGIGDPDAISHGVGDLLSCCRIEVVLPRQSPGAGGDRVRPTSRAAPQSRSDRNDESSNVRRRCRNRRS